MIATTNAGALVKGAAAGKPKVVKLTVTRAFCIAGVRQDVGGTVEVTEAFGRELAAMGKAIAYVEEPLKAGGEERPDAKDRDKPGESKAPRGQEKAK